MTGTTTVQKASFNFSGSRFSPVMSHVNASVDHIERPLMTPDEIMRLRPPKKEGNGDSEKITEPGDMLIFVSGHYPILGMQILYFADPELARRAGIPPPTGTTERIQKLRVQIDAPEFITDDDIGSELERGFVEELRRG
jgi:type IV secretion system protein VirD4